MDDEVFERLFFGVCAVIVLAILRFFFIPIIILILLICIIYIFGYCIEKIITWWEKRGNKSDGNDEIYIRSDNHRFY